MSITSKFRHTMFIVTALGLSIAATACSVAGDKPAAAAPQPDPNKPAVLLVHGAFADGSSWSRVAERLQRDGYRVTSAAVPLRGLTYDSAYIRGLLDAMPDKTILVGHSYGGAVITNAAAGSPKVKGLVYVAAFAPDKGESLGELDARYGGPATKITVPQNYPLSTGGTAPELVISQEQFPANFAQDLPADEAAVLASAQRPVAVAAFTETTVDPAWKSIPSWYLVARDDHMIPVDGQRAMAKRINATVVEHDGSHAIALSQPTTVTELIESAATAAR
ncbi:alpha/beta hydrolase [Nocardia sp. NPDC052001]|uniref:alpha/beta fold hydrolase n=1 Tax=Nocardia sp. NPDC052001 TaxID=3154853 RepID=UPI00341A5133